MANINGMGNSNLALNLLQSTGGKGGRRTALAAMNLLQNDSALAMMQAKVAYKLNSAQTGQGAAGTVEAVNASSLTNSREKLIKLPLYEPRADSGGLSLSKTSAAASDKEFEKSIIALAQKNAAADKAIGDQTDDYKKLKESFISVVSPDRKGIIAAAAKTTVIPADFDADLAKAYDESGKLIAVYNGKKGWTNKPTAAESAREKAFNAIYEKAFRSEAERLKLESAKSAAVSDDRTSVDMIA